LRAQQFPGGRKFFEDLKFYWRGFGSKDLTRIIIDEWERPKEELDRGLEAVREADRLCNRIYRYAYELAPYLKSLEVTNVSGRKFLFSTSWDFHYVPGGKEFRGSPFRPSRLDGRFILIDPVGAVRRALDFEAIIGAKVLPGIDYTKVFKTWLNLQKDPGRFAGTTATEFFVRRYPGFFFEQEKIAEQPATPIVEDDGPRNHERGFWDKAKSDYTQWLKGRTRDNGAKDLIESFFKQWKRPEEYAAITFDKLYTAIRHNHKSCWNESRR
jgi:hypothetical protein